MVTTLWRLNLQTQTDEVSLQTYDPTGLYSQVQICLCAREDTGPQKAVESKAPGQGFRIRPGVCCSSAAC